MRKQWKGFSAFVLLTDLMHLSRSEIEENFVPHTLF